MEKADIRALRRQHWTSSVDAQFVRTFIDHSLTPYVESLLTQIRDNPENMRADLREAKEEVALQIGEPAPGRFVLTLAVIIKELIKKLQSYARDAYDPTHPENFICLYDVSYGVQQGVSLLQAVIQELYGMTDYRQKLQIDPTSTADPSQFKKTAAVDEYKWAKQVVAAIDKLSLDPSGFSLLDEMVAQVEQDYKQARTADVIIAGAHSGQQVYKALYPLTEGI